jgi:hypothetical protein
MDIYSNILYVKEEFAALSALAHRCAAADKYRPETCCVIGNYYSLRWAGVWYFGGQDGDGKRCGLGNATHRPAARRRPGGAQVCICT